MRDIWTKKAVNASVRLEAAQKVSNFTKMVSDKNLDCKTEEMLTTKAPESEKKQDLTSNKGEKAEPIIQSSDDKEIQISGFREVTFSFGIFIYFIL